MRDTLTLIDFSFFETVDECVDNLNSILYIYL